MNMSSRLVGCLAECHFLFFLKKLTITGDSGEPMATLSVHRAAVEAENQRSKDLVEKSNIVFIKNKIHGIPN